MTLRDNISEVRLVYFKSHKGSALITSISLLLMAIIAGIAYGYLYPQIVIHGDAVATKQLILDNSHLFTIELVLWWIIVLLDITVSFSLFSFFKKNSSLISLITMVLRLLYSFILGISIITLSTAQNIEVNSLSRIMQFENTWSIGLIVFGIHLFLLGFMSLKSNIVPKIFSWLIIIGGFSYVLIHSLKAMTAIFGNVASIIEPFLSIPMALSEVLLSIWLIYGVIKSLRKNATYA